MLLHGQYERGRASGDPNDALHEQTECALFGLEQWPADIFAILVTAATLFVRLGLEDRLDGAPTLVIFTVPIMLSAYLGGTRSGLLATAFSLAGASYCLLPPLRSLRVESAAQQWDRCFIALSMAAAQSVGHFGSWELELAASGALDANALRCSDEMFRIAGYEPGAVVVTKELFFRLVPAKEHRPIRQAMATAFRERTPYSIVHRLMTERGLRLDVTGDLAPSFPGISRSRRIISKAGERSPEVLSD